MASPRQGAVERRLAAILADGIRRREFIALFAGATAAWPLVVSAQSPSKVAFDAMNRDMPDAILMVSDPLTGLNRKRVFEFAAAHRLPAIYEFESLAREGGLMSYGPDTNEGFARVAALVDRILKGAKPADLPFEQPTRFRFVLNLKAAKSLGLTVPLTLQASADEVIE
jgi:putative tryptophan/tyrosine transport system substrate-binding protein